MNEVKERFFLNIYVSVFYNRYWAVFSLNTIMYHNCLSITPCNNTYRWEVRQNNSLSGLDVRWNFNLRPKYGPNGVIYCINYFQQANATCTNKGFHMWSNDKFDTAFAVHANIKFFDTGLRSSRPLIITTKSDLVRTMVLRKLPSHVHFNFCKNPFLLIFYILNNKFNVNNGFIWKCQKR